MQFTVIIATRNRPVLFARALNSVLGQSILDQTIDSPAGTGQSGPAVEVIVVNDGSDPAHVPAYQALADAAGDKARCLWLQPSQRGHGHNFALNHGAARAGGNYICFLDDDDEWTDPTYLERLDAQLQADAAPPVDLHLSDQDAYQGGARIDRVIWIEDLHAKVRERLTQDRFGAYRVTPADLLACHGFSHLNTLVIRAALLRAIGGLDDFIRYEGDRDFYLRAIDAAGLIKYTPQRMARHNIPDPARQDNLSTVVTTLEKRIFQIRVLDKAILLSRRPEIQAYARRVKAQILKRIATELHEAGAHDRAAYYAREALLVGFGFKWLGFCLFVHLRTLLGGDATRRIVSR